VEEECGGEEDAGIGSGGIVSVDRRFGWGYPVIVYVGMCSMIFYLKTYHLHSSDHEY
jgi:hypothetical protein